MPFLQSLKRPKVYLSVIAGVLIIAFIAHGKKAQTPETVVASRSDVVQEVQVSGTVKASQKVDLAFERSARVYKNYVKVGDSVREGQILAIQEQGSQAGDYSAAAARVQGALATVVQYEAGVSAAQARLAELSGGARPEELALKDADVAKAQATLTASITDYTTALSNAYSVADSAVHVTLGSLFSGSPRAGYVLGFSTCDPQARTDAMRLRGDIETLLTSWLLTQATVSGTASVSSLTAEYDVTVKNLNQVKKLTDVLSRTVNACNQSDSTVVGYQTSINTVRDLMNTTVAGLVSAKVSAENQESQVQKVRNDRDLSEKSARSEQIDSQTAAVLGAQAQLHAQQAALLQAKAQLQSAGSVLAQGAIRAPISGLVTRNDLKEGEVANGFTPVITVQDTNFELEAYIPETDIAKIQKDLKARVTLDAYGSDEFFAAHVGFIDPAETKVEGVSTYKVKIQFDAKDARVRSGMTANVFIETARHANVIAIPERAVTLSGTDRVVRVFHDDKTISEVVVTIGLRGSAGLVEIIKGVQEGMKLVTSSAP